MTDPISITGIVLASFSTIAIGITAFIKGIKKCNISKNGISIERSMENNELINQQEYTIKLIKLLRDIDNNKIVDENNNINERLQDIINVLDEENEKEKVITNFISKRKKK